MSDLKFEDLPDEIILKVMSDLETEDLFSWWKLSKRFKAISQDESLWPKGSFFKLILWCLSDPQTLVPNHCS